MDSDSDDTHPVNVANQILSVTVTTSSGCWRCIQLRVSDSTDVDQCGLQAWPCSTLLIDWFLHEFGIEGLRASSILELGAGPGLIATALSPYTSSYTATDCNPAVLDLCRSNLCGNGAHASIVPLDLFDDSACLRRFNANYIIAADLIYDNDLSDALITAASGYLSGGAAGRFLIANESRLNFLIETMAVGDAAMDYFMQGLRRSKLGIVRIDCDSIPTSTDLIRSSSSFLIEVVAVESPSCQTDPAP